MIRLPRYFWLAIVVCWPTLAFAETLSMKAQNGDFVRLYDEPCEVKSEWFAKWKRANFHYQKKDYPSCWTLQQGMVVILDSAGEVSTLPTHAFEKDEAI